MLSGERQALQEGAHCWALASPGGGGPGVADSSRAISPKNMASIMAWLEPIGPTWIAWAVAFNRAGSRQFTRAVSAVNP